MKQNPFKFGSVVDGKYFTNRKSEISELKSILSSENHLVIISPRRFGKTSLVKIVTNQLSRPTVYLDLQLIVSIEDLAAQLLKRVYRIFPFQKLKSLIKNFRIIPKITINPINNEVDITFHSNTDSVAILEDVLNLIDNLGQKKVIVVIDEFQEINRISKDLDKYLRAVIQHHKNINYVFLGSQEHLMRDIFEKKNSSFYHFGYLFILDKIPELEFKTFIGSGLKKLISKTASITEQILAVTKSHPYYTQQFAFMVFEGLSRNSQLSDENVVSDALSTIIRIHDMDFERLWNTLNRTDMAVLIGMSDGNLTPLSSEFSRKVNIQSSSTIFSSLKRLSDSGIIVKLKQKYEIDDPFFARWIIMRRDT